MSATTIRRKRTEAERAQERYDLAVRKIDKLEARRAALTKDVEDVDRQLDEAHAVRNSYANFPGVIAEHPADVDPAQTSIDEGSISVKTSGDLP